MGPETLDGSALPSVPLSLQHPHGFGRFGPTHRVRHEDNAIGSPLGAPDVVQAEDQLHVFADSRGPEAPDLDDLFQDGDRRGAQAGERVRRLEPRRAEPT